MKPHQKELIVAEITKVSSKIPTSISRFGRYRTNDAKVEKMI